MSKNFYTGLRNGILLSIPLWFIIISFIVFIYKFLK